MQTFSAEDYRGQRVRMTADVRSEEVEGWAGLWMRVDGPQRGKSLSFANMQDRPLEGSRPWHEYAIVLDVPERSRAIAFGILLSGKGQVWVDNFNFEIVDQQVPTTGSSPLYSVPKEPKNLSFDDD